jgi:hypothetical protein
MATSAQEFIPVTLMPGFFFEKIKKSSHRNGRDPRRCEEGVPLAYSKLGQTLIVCQIFSMTIAMNGSTVNTSPARENVFTRKLPSFSSLRSAGENNPER